MVRSLQTLFMVQRWEDEHCLIQGENGGERQLGDGWVWCWPASKSAAPFLNTSYIHPSRRAAAHMTASGSVCVCVCVNCLSMSEPSLDSYYLIPLSFLALHHPLLTILCLSPPPLFLVLSLITALVGDLILPLRAGAALPSRPPTHLWFSLCLTGPLTTSLFARWASKCSQDTIRVIHALSHWVKARPWLSPWMVHAALRNCGSALR